MALELFWYDFVCFGIVSVAFLCAAWVIWRKEGGGSKSGSGTMYESLLVARSDGDAYVSVLPNGHVSTSQLWSSCWKGVHPKWLLATRFISFAAMAGFLSWDVVDWDASILLYYTEWTFLLVMAYFALGTVISAYGCWLFWEENLDQCGERTEIQRGDIENSGKTFRVKEIKPQSHYAQEQQTQKRAGFVGYSMQIAYQICGGAVVLTDIVFWCVIVPFLSNAHLGLNLLMGCMHAMNAFFLLLDSTLNSLPFPWFRLSYFVIWSCIYVVFQWVIHACGFSWWPYPFLELDTQWAPFWYLCLALIHVPCYGIFALIVRAKYSILPRWFPRAFVISTSSI